MVESKQNKNLPSLITSRSLSNKYCNVSRQDKVSITVQTFAEFINTRDKMQNTCPSYGSKFDPYSLKTNLPLKCVADNNKYLSVNHICLYLCSSVPAPNQDP